MRRSTLVGLTLTCLRAPAAAAPAATQEELTAPVAGRAAEWVQMHGIPFDESRLHRLRKTNREEWARLRHDVRTIAQLAAQRGWKDPRRLANTPPAGGPGGLQVLVRDLAARTTTVAGPAAPLGSFDTGAGAPAPTPGPLCSLSPPAW